MKKQPVKKQTEPTQLLPKSITVEQLSKYDNGKHERYVYPVTKTVNTIHPRVETTLSEKEVETLINEGVTVEVYRWKASR